MLKSLTFVVVFAHNLLLKVNQSDNEKKWLNLKRRISHLFKDTMAERPQETEFEVWVVEDNDLQACNRIANGDTDPSGNAIIRPSPSNNRNPWPHIKVQHLGVGCIVWLPSRGDDSDKSIKYIREFCCSNRELQGSGYNHPVVVLKVSPSNFGDAVCSIVQVRHLYCVQRGNEASRKGEIGNCMGEAKSDGIVYCRGRNAVQYTCIMISMMPWSSYYRDLSIRSVTFSFTSHCSRSCFIAALLLLPEFVAQTPTASDRYPHSSTSPACPCSSFLQ